MHPQFEELAKDYGGKGVKVLGVHTAFEDFDDQTDAKVKEYVTAKKFGYPVAIAKSAEGKSPQVMDDYRTGGTPCIVVLDKKGVVRFKTLGEFEQGKLTELLDQLLKEGDGKEGETKEK